MSRYSKEQIHHIMSSVKNKNTKPEIIVRKYLWNKGFRYRLNHPRLPGKPDIVLRKYRTCIFVNGCFWHGHEGCGNYREPHTNSDFWKEKVNRNHKRDIDVQKKLASMGWYSITIWECELKKEKREKTLESLAFTLNHIFLENYKVKQYTLPENHESSMAAEPEVHFEKKPSSQLE